MASKSVKAIDRSYPNQWGAAKRTIKVQFLPFLPAYALPSLLFYLIIPVARPFFLGLVILQVLLYITKNKWGVGFMDLPRFIKAQINNNKLHGHRYHRRKSGTALWSALLGLMFVLGPGSIPNAEASYEIIIPQGEAGDREPNVKSNLAEMSMINRQTIHQGFGHDTPLYMLMQQIIPKSFRVKWRDAELRDMTVSWRSYDMDTVEIMEDIAERYGIRFRYSNRSGMVHVEWLDDTCIRGLDRAQVYSIIC